MIGKILLALFSYKNFIYFIELFFGQCPLEKFNLPKGHCSTQKVQCFSLYSKMVKYW